MPGRPLAKPPLGSPEAAAIAARKGTKGGRPKRKLRLVVPKIRPTLDQAIRASCEVLGAQVLALQQKAEVCGLTLTEQQWLCDLHDRLAKLEGQRMAITMQALSSPHLNDQQRQQIVDMATDQARPALPVVDVPALEPPK